MAGRCSLGLARLQAVSAGRRIEVLPTDSRSAFSDTEARPTPPSLLSLLARQKRTGFRTLVIRTQRLIESTTRDACPDGVFGTHCAARAIPSRRERCSQTQPSSLRNARPKTISMVPEQMDVRIYGDTAIMIIQLRSREQTPDGHTIDHRGRPERKCLCGAVAGNSSHNLPVHRWSSSCPLHASDRISRSDIGAST